MNMERSDYIECADCDGVITSTSRHAFIEAAIQIALHRERMAVIEEELHSPYGMARINAAMQLEGSDEIERALLADWHVAQAALIAEADECRWIRTCPTCYRHFCLHDSTSETRCNECAAHMREEARR